MYRASTRDRPDPFHRTLITPSSPSTPVATETATDGDAPAARSTAGAVAWDVGRALLGEVRPLPTVAAMTAGVTGMAIGGNLAGWPRYAAFLAAVLYAAHMKDAYVDWYVRGEDQLYPWGDGPQTGQVLPAAALAGLIGGALGVAAVLVLTFPADVPALFYPLAAAMGLLAVLYAGRLDAAPGGSALAYPVGVGLALVGGGLLAVGRVVPATLLYAVPLVVVLAGAKIVEDLIDAGHDEALGKRTVPVALGPARARDVGYAMVAVGLLPLALLHPAVGVAVLGALTVAIGSARLDVERGIYPLVVGVYVVMVAVLALALLGLV